jgi:hypothetical protein
MTRKEVIMAQHNNAELDGKNSSKKIAFIVSGAVVVVVAIVLLVILIPKGSDSDNNSGSNSNGSSQTTEDNSSNSSQNSNSPKKSGDGYTVSPTGSRNPFEDDPINQYLPKKGSEEAQQLGWWGEFVATEDGHWHLFIHITDYETDYSTKKGNVSTYFGDRGIYIYLPDSNTSSNPADPYGTTFGQY